MPETMTTWSSMIAARAADATPAVVTNDLVWSGKELLRRAAGAADWLEAAGVTKGTTVPALVASSPQAIALVIAGAGSGRPVAPLGPRLTVRELEACIASMEAPFVVADPEFADVAREAAGRTRRRVELVEAFAPSARPLALDPQPDSVAFVLHTSGTTGNPKAVPIREDRLAARARHNARFLSLGSDSVATTASPFHHIAGVGVLAVALAAGSAVVPIARFSVDAWRRLGTLGVTNALLVPTMIEMLLEDDALALESLRLLQYGASPIRPQTLRRVLVELDGVRLVQIYGQTEGTPITCLTQEDHELAAAGRTELLKSVGRAVPGLDLRIETPDEDGIGEVWAKAEHLFRPDPDGWLRTEDMGQIDDDGYLYLVGRKGDMIIRGGENVYPAEVEEVLVAHPGVREVAVVGVADARWGEIVTAFVVPTDPLSPPDPEDLRGFARTQLAGFKVPAAWAFVKQLPRNAAGKLLRKELVKPMGGRNGC